MTIPASSETAPDAAFLAGLIGRPWAAGAAGPEAYDCWGLVSDLQRRLWGRDLAPAAQDLDAASPREVMEAIRASRLQRRWLPVDSPAPGDIVLMSRRADPVHVGVWIAPGPGQEGVIHAVREHGVVFQTLAQLRAGWRRVEFRRHCGKVVDALPGDIPEAIGTRMAVVILRDPLDPLAGSLIHAPRDLPGSPAEALRGLEAQLPDDFWLVLNDTPLLRRHPETGEDEWHSARIGPGSVLWVIPPLPEGDDGSQIMAVLATVAIAIAAPYAAVALGFAAGSLGAQLVAAGLALGANMLVSTFMPQNNPVNNALPAPSPTYTLGAPQNQLRPGGVVPVTYGTMRRFPELMAQPWGAYAGNEHFIFLLLCVGAGHHRVNEFGVEDTPVWINGAGQTGAMDDLEFEIVQPGNPVTLFPTNIRVSSEVGGQELLAPPPVEQRVGNFIAVPSGEQAVQLQCDFVFPRGLFDLTGGGRPAEASVSWRVDVREVDDNGVNIGAWTEARAFTLTGATTTPKRLSRNIPLPHAGRWKVRAVRTSETNVAHPNGQDRLVWAGLRAIIAGDRVYPDVCALAIKMRATETSSQGATRWYVDATRQLNHWDPVGLSWPWGATEGIEAAVRDVCTAEYGLDLPLSRVDLPALQALAETWADRGDVCCLTIDTAQSAWDVLEAVLLPGRARPQFIGNMVTFVRDQPRALPAQLITHADMVRGSFRVDRLHFRRESPNVVTVRYRDRNGAAQSVTCQPPGVTAPRPATVEIKGIVDHDAAWRHGMYLAASNNLRRRFLSFTLLGTGRALLRGDLVAVSHPRPLYGRPARLIERIGDRQLRISEAHGIAADEAQWIAIQRPDGSYWGPCAVIASNSGDPAVLKLRQPDFNEVIGSDAQAVGYSPDPRDWMVAEADLSPLSPGGTELLDGRQSEPTRVAVGPLGAETLNCLVVELMPRPDGTVEVLAVEEHPGVHTAEQGQIAPAPVIARDPIFPAGPAWIGASAVTRELGGIWQALVTGPSLPGATSYTAELSTDGGSSWAGRTVAVEPRLELELPEETAVEVRFAAIGLMRGPWGYATIDGTTGAMISPALGGDFNADFGNDFAPVTAAAGAAGDFGDDFGVDFALD